MNEEVYEILRAAVTIAKDLQVRRVATLRKHLLDRFPGRDNAITEALKAWADYVKAKR